MLLPLKAAAPFPKKHCARHEAAACPFHEVRVLLQTTLHHLKPHTPAFDMKRLSITQSRSPTVMEQCKIDGSRAPAAQGAYRPSIYAPAV